MFPSFSGEELDEIEIPSPDELRRLSRKYKKRTSIGTDWIHPRCVALLSDSALLAMTFLWRVMLLHGQVPAAIATILISLIPKKESGDRPVANMPTFVRIMARWLRRTIGRKWEQLNIRSYIYGATGKASMMAVWRLSIFGEYALAKGLSSFGLLLDIAKAFESVSHSILAQRALKRKFNPLVLRLWPAIYSGPRRLVVNKVGGRSVQTQNCAIVAGDSLADFFMRAMMLEVVDELLSEFPAVQAAVVADDIQLLAAGSEAYVKTTAVDISKKAFELMESSRLPISTPKLVVLASSPSLAEAICEKVEGLEKAHVKCSRNLGVDYKLSRASVGNRSVLKSRLCTAKQQAQRARQLRRAGANVGPLLQRGVRPLGLYGVQVVGMSNAEIRSLRSSMNIALSTPGKSSTVQLALKGIADPICDAHAMVTGTWATAWFDGWVPRTMMEATFAAAIAAYEGDTVWGALPGPAAVTYASLRRIGWEANSAADWQTMDGHKLSLSDVGPLSVKQLDVHDAETLAWRSAAANHLHLSHLTRCPLLSPLKKLLETTDDRKGWHGEHQVVLRSLLAGAFMFDDRCCLCGATVVGLPGHHFYWECDGTRAWRDAFGLLEGLLQAAKDNKLNAFLCSGIAVDPLSLAPGPLLELEASWVVTPPEGLVFVGDAYGDAGSVQGPSPRHIRCSWAVVTARCVDGVFCATAVLAGNYPALHQAVPAAEAYAFLMFLCHCLPGPDGLATYFTDNQWVHDSWREPAAKTTCGTACFAELWRRIHAKAADIGYEAIVVRKVKSHRSLASAQGPDDLAAIAGNNLADKAAKDAASRLPTLAGAAEIVKKTASASDVVARFLAHIHLQYHRRFGSLPRRQAADVAKDSLRVTQSSKQPHYPANSVHDKRWRCLACLASSGSLEWFMAQKCEAPRGNVHPHLSLPGLVFCKTCGAHSCTSVKLLSHACSPCVKARLGTALSRGCSSESTPTP